jgi:hypothetical protein
MAHLSRWMAVRDVAPAALGRGEIAQFVRDRQATHPHMTSPRSLDRLLGHLRRLGAVPRGGLA